MKWAEDDFDPPPGTYRLDLSEPVDGQTYVMYHGTTRASAAAIQKSGFQQSSDGMLGRGVYLSRDLQKASRYPLKWPEGDKVVIKVKVRVGKVIRIDRQNHLLQKTWHNHGYDTAWVPPHCGMVPSGLEEDCVWDPARIKIIQIIKPTRTPEHGQITTDTNMYWAEDDFDLPAGTYRLGLPQPVNDRTYVMYHGTTRASAAAILKSGFRQSSDGMLGCGVYLSRDLQKASRYPINHPESDRVVIKVKVQVGKVIRIDHQNHPLQKTWHYCGYDTAHVPPHCGMVPSGLEEDCVWDPARIEILKTINPT